MYIERIFWMVFIWRNHKCNYIIKIKIKIVHIEKIMDGFCKCNYIKENSKHKLYHFLKEYYKKNYKVAKNTFLNLKTLYDI